MNTTGLLENGEYGFFWYKLHNLPGLQVTETTWCAVGAMSQVICVDDILDRVSVQQADSTGIEDPSDPVFLAMNPFLSFDKMEKKKKKSKSDKSKSFRGNKSDHDKSWEYPSESKSQD